MKPRRVKVRRFTSGPSKGLPLDIDRCSATVQRHGELVPDRCQRARVRGHAYCRQHLQHLQQLQDGQDG